MREFASTNQKHYPRLCSDTSSVKNRPFAASHSRGTKPPCWRAKKSHWNKTNKLDKLVSFVCHATVRHLLSSGQHGGFAPREWLAAKSLFMQSFLRRHFAGKPKVVRREISAVFRGG